jgi:hypothetical protein
MNLPSELIFEVALRMGAREVVAFMLTCKDYRDLIENYRHSLLKDMLQMQHDRIQRTVDQLDMAGLEVIQAFENFTSRMHDLGLEYIEPASRGQYILDTFVRRHRQANDRVYKVWYKSLFGLYTGTAIVIAKQAETIRKRKPPPVWVRATPSNDGSRAQVLALRRCVNAGAADLKMAYILSGNTPPNRKTRLQWARYFTSGQSPYARFLRKLKTSQETVPKSSNITLVDDDLFACLDLPGVPDQINGFYTFTPPKAHLKMAVAMLDGQPAEPLFKIWMLQHVWLHLRWDEKEYETWRLSDEDDEYGKLRGGEDARKLLIGISDALSSKA